VVNDNKIFKFIYINTAHSHSLESHVFLPKHSS